MAKPWEYARWRRVAMQAAMGVVLLGTVGLAALVNHTRRRDLTIVLGATLADGPVSYRLPDGWRVSPRVRVRPGLRFVRVATEPGADGPRRTITVTRESLREPVPALDYLLARGQILPPGDMREGEDAAREIAVDGYKGVRVTNTVRRLTPEGPVVATTITACVVLPTADAFEVKLDEPGRFGKVDEALMDALLAAIRVTLPPGTGRELNLGGAKLVVPAAFTLMNRGDPLRTGRQLLQARPNGVWVRAEVSPYLALENEGAVEERVGAIAFLLASRRLDPRDPDPDVGWTRSVATPFADADRWGVKLDLPIHSEDALPRRAYALVNGAGQGVLVVLTGAPKATADDFDAAWASLFPAIKLPPRGPDLAARLDAGTKAVASLTPADVRKLSPPGGERWWLWSSPNAPAKPEAPSISAPAKPDDSDGDATGADAPGGPDEKPSSSPAPPKPPASPDEPAPVGWTCEADAADGLSGSRETRRAAEDNVVAHVDYHWTLSGTDLKAFSTTTAADFNLTAADANTTGDNGRAASFAEQVLANAKQLDLELQGPLAPINQLLPRPPQFVPGQLLPAALPRLVTAPMILLTDRVWPDEAKMSPRPVVLLARPVTAPASAGAGATCVELEVNGSGQLSRWTFSPDGELQSAEFGGGLRLRPSTRAEIMGLFQADPRLTPAAR